MQLANLIDGLPFLGFVVGMILTSAVLVLSIAKAAGQEPPPFPKDDTEKE